MPDETKMWWITAMQTPTVAFIPGTDETITSHSHEELWAKWLRECNSRGIALDNPKKEFQNCCCMALPPHKRAQCCAFVTDDDATPALLRQKRVIGLGDINAFFVKSAAWLKSSESVSQEEAERRASVCQLCPQNVQAYLPGCASCTGIFNKIAEGVMGVIGIRSTTQDSNLNHCGVCACNLKILVHCPLSVLQEHRDKKHDYPAFCWQMEGASDGPA